MPWHSRNICKPARRCYPHVGDSIWPIRSRHDTYYLANKVNGSLILASDPRSYAGAAYASTITKISGWRPFMRAV
jgi:hypothetical protein